MMKPKPSANKSTAVIAFIEAALRVPEGRHVGRPITLMEWQKRFIADVYDNPAGTRRAILSIARKNGKSAVVAALALAHLAGPLRKQNQQIAIGARSIKQASIIFKLAEKMVALNPALAARINVKPSIKSMIDRDTGGELFALAAEGATAHGYSPSVVILDELGAVVGPSDPFVEALVTAQLAYDDALTLCVSTQAASDGDLFSQWIDDARTSGDPRQVCHLYTAALEMGIDDPEAWRAANPAIGGFLNAEAIGKEADVAMRLSSARQSFEWLHLNRRVTRLSGLVPRDAWAAVCSPDARIPEGASVTGGLDLSAVRDLTALVLIYDDGDRKIVEPHFWLPSEGLREKAAKDRAPYDAWAKDGFLHTVDGPVITYDAVASDIAELARRYEFGAIAFDRWRINDFKAALDRVGLELELVEHGQGYRDFGPAVDRLERAIANKELLAPVHPILTMCIMGAVVESDQAGNRKLNKAKASQRIDGAVALAMALTADATAPKVARSYLDDGSPLWFI